MATFIFGHHAVTAAIEAGKREIFELYVTDKYIDRYKQYSKQLNNTKIVKSKAKELDSRFKDKVHQGIAAKVGPIAQPCLEDVLETANRLLILDQISDPHNLGACLRSANAFGCDAVIIPDHNSASLTDVAIKAAAGAAEVTPLVNVSNINKAMDLIKNYNFWTVGLDGYADQEISDVDLKGKIAVVMGSEGKGLRDLVKKNCDFLAKIPMPGNVESLNVSVATGVTLYEVARQQG